MTLRVAGGYMYILRRRETALSPVFILQEIYSVIVHSTRRVKWRLEYVVVCGGRGGSCGCTQRECDRSPRFFVTAPRPHQKDISKWLDKICFRVSQPPRPHSLGYRVYVTITPDAFHFESTEFDTCHETRTTKKASGW